MTITYHTQVEQGSDEWLQLRCGIVTASIMARILTGTLKVADNDKSRAIEWELLSQRISGHVEPQYVSDSMLRGQEDEILARDLYSKTYAKVTEIGFVTRAADDGTIIGYSPDGLVGEDGLIECKSRYQRFQIETIVTGLMPIEYMMQIQTGLFVTQRKWCDFVSYSNGLPMFVKRIMPDPYTHSMIAEAVDNFEHRLKNKLDIYNQNLSNGEGLTQTERRYEGEMTL